MNQIKPFTGFPEAGLQFLADLAANNNKEWFTAHKATYLATVRDPAIAFVAALGEQLKLISKDIRYDLRTNGSGSMMRINRDIRFSQDKSPYKTAVGIRFWEGPGKAAQHPGFGINIEPTGAGMMAGLFHFDKPWLQRYRAAVIDDALGAQLVEAIQAVQGAGDYQIQGEHYKRVPRGFDKDHARADWLRYAGLWTSSPRIDVSTLTTPNLVAACLEHGRNMAAIQQWLAAVQAQA